MGQMTRVGDGSFTDLSARSSIVLSTSSSTGSSTGLPTGSPTSLAAAFWDLAPSGAMLLCSGTVQLPGPTETGTPGQQRRNLRRPNTRIANKDGKIGVVLEGLSRPIASNARWDLPTDVHS